MVRRTDVPESLRSGRIVAIVRSRTGTHLDAACDALVDAGLQAIEVTSNTPGASAAISRLSARGVEVGMGTVRTLDHVKMAIDAGATFVVTPTTSIPVGEAALLAGLRWFPGAMTPTEIEVAWAAGATAVKIFPAGPLGGARYLRDVLAPLDDIAVVPTGGVGIEDIGDYLRAGATALGIGSPLMGDVVETGDMRALTLRVLAAQDAVREATS